VQSRLTLCDTASRTKAVRVAGIHVRDHARNHIALTADGADDWYFAGTDAASSAAAPALIPMCGTMATTSFSSTRRRGSRRRWRNLHCSPWLPRPKVTPVAEVPQVQLLVPLVVEVKKPRRQSPHSCLFPLPPIEDRPAL
jgi:hypothetical protein